MGISSHTPNSDWRFRFRGFGVSSRIPFALWEIPVLAIHFTGRMAKVQYLTNYNSLTRGASSPREMHNETQNGPLRSIHRTLAWREHHSNIRLSHSIS
jgi:hypothetical protein